MPVHLVLDSKINAGLPTPVNDWQKICKDDARVGDLVSIKSSQLLKWKIIVVPRA